MKIKIRLDNLIVKKNFAESREQAKRLILAGQVKKGEAILDKPGLMIFEDEEIDVLSLQKYVSRGGDKLEGFMKNIDCDVNGMTCLDIGSSTGGFTDYLLQNGALSVTCVDVGSKILHWKLRNDKRVILIENVNARYLSQYKINDNFDLSVTDVSFISLKLILTEIIPLIKQNGNIVCLVKPQFEAGKENIDKGGIVKSKDIQDKCVQDIIDFGISNGLKFIKKDPSCLKGQKGNQEYFVLWRKE